MLGLKLNHVNKRAPLNSILAQRELEISTKPLNSAYTNFQVEISKHVKKIVTNRNFSRNRIVKLEIIAPKWNITPNKMKLKLYLYLYNQIYPGIANFKSEKKVRKLRNVYEW